MILKIDLLEELKQNKLDIFDFKNCLFNTKIFNTKSKYIDLRNWIRYMAVEYGDADQVLKIDFNVKLLEKLNWYNRETCSSKKYFDCIFSMKTFFNAFLKMYFGDRIPYYGELMDSYDEFICEKKIEEFANNKAIKKEEVDKLFEEINKLAKNTHTLGNYMPCPDGKYNKMKGYGKGYEYFQDRLELLYAALKSEEYPEYLDGSIKKKWLDWFDKQNNLWLDEILDNEDLMKYTCKSKTIRGGHIRYEMDSAEDIQNYYEYISHVNNVIEKRNKTIISKLKS